MGKKNNSFNLFDFESEQGLNSDELSESVAQEASSEEEYFSIINVFAQEEAVAIASNKNADEDESFSGAQLSLFANEASDEFFVEATAALAEEQKKAEKDTSPDLHKDLNEDTVYVPSETEQEEITEPIPEELISEATEDKIIEETVEEEIIEDAIKNKTVEEAIEEEIVEDAIENKTVEDAVEEEIIEDAIEEEIENETVEEVIEDEFVEETIEDETLKEPGDDEIIEDTEPVIEEFFVEEVVADESDVEMATKALEDNILDQEAEFTVSKADDDVFAGLTKFEDIKNTPVLASFETPYVFTGKNGPHIRYRLSLPSNRNPKKARTVKAVLSWMLTITLAVAIAIFLRMFVFVIATVDGPSMMPTLSTGEKLFVSKCAYYFSEVERGDIIICEYNTAGYNDMYVKRVIGLGGDRIRVTEGVLYVNDVVVEEDYIKAPGNDIEEYIVPVDCIYVLGDNRRNSTDSEELGPISKDYVIGKVIFRLSPFTNLEG
ncbi:MAG: signal peptidase I [Clostridia bacterium]|nr:signal peptidase I [Clostridia bacterium]